MGNSQIDNYMAFLESKIKRINESGFEIDDNLLNVHLFDFQRHIILI